LNIEYTLTKKKKNNLKLTKEKKMEDPLERAVKRIERLNNILIITIIVLVIALILLI
jgi:cell division protein FtsL